MSKRKFVVVTFSDGATYRIPAEFIARARTEYYALKDGIEEGSPDWNAEMKQSMDDFELIDWVKNNMDWEDVRPNAVRLFIRPKDYSEEWTNAEMAAYEED